MCWAPRKVAEDCLLVLVCGLAREQPAWQQVSESGEHFPPCRRAWESACEAGIEDEVSPQVVVQCPQVAHGIAPQKRLSEMPYFCGHAELVPERMRHRDRLAELS